MNEFPTWQAGSLNLIRVMLLHGQKDIHSDSRGLPWKSCIAARGGPFMTQTEQDHFGNVKTRCFQLKVSNFGINLCGDPPVEASKPVLTAP